MKSLDPYRWLVALVVLALLAGGAYWYRGQLIQQGYDTAMGEVRVVQHELALKQIRETDRLYAVINTLKDQADVQKKTVADFRADQLVAAQRMRNQKADFDARVSTAGAEALRGYAQATDADLERARADVERYGLEAVNCSIAAHTLKGFVDAQP